MQGPIPAGNPTGPIPPGRTQQPAQLIPFSSHGKTNSNPGSHCAHPTRQDKPVQFFPFSPHPGLSYRWLLNEFPNFIPADGRRFISQATGNLYIAKTEASDTGNYSCFATSHMDFITKSVFSKFSHLSLAAEGQCSWVVPKNVPKFPFLWEKSELIKPWKVSGLHRAQIIPESLLRASKIWMGWGGREAALSPRFPVCTPPIHGVSVFLKDNSGRGNRELNWKKAWMDTDWSNLG